MSAENQPEKKLIIDEDWKSQVEAEKEAARQQSDQPAPTAEEADRAEHGPMPPATLSFLVSTLYLQASMALGAMPNPLTGKAEVSPQQAKHFIDLLAMLQQKTEGNRTPEESEDFEAALHELRMAYVQVNPVS